MLKLGQERESLKVVDDQFGSPTYAPHLARFTLQALEKAVTLPDFPSGVYHAVNQGITTWCDFSRAIFESARVKGFALKINRVDPVPSSEYPTPARRPTNSRLSTAKAERVFGILLPTWQEGLNECIELSQP
jgi:dTDP-4-dehydrorhamnose reductase